MSRIRSLLVTLLVAQLPAQGESPDPKVHVDRERGFRIERPAKGWKFQRTTSNSVVTLHILPENGKGTVGAFVRVQAASQAEDTAAVLRKALARIARDDAYSETERLGGQKGGQKGDQLGGQLGGNPARGVRVRYAGPNDTDYRLEQRYLVTDGTRFILQFHAPVARWKELAPTFRTIRASFQLMPMDEAARTARRLADLAARCGSEIEWARSFREAAARAKKENKLVLVQFRAYGGFDLPDVTKSTLYMHTDIVELIGERFVALRYHRGMPAPFREQKNYGMSKSTFGQAVMLVTPEGKVLRETSSIHPHAVYDFLVDGLRRHRGYAGGPVLEGLRSAEQFAAWHLARGELDDAVRKLKHATGAQAHRLRATLYRRQRKGEAALQEIERARSVGDDSVDLVAEQILVLLRMNRARDARRVLARYRRLHRNRAGDPVLLFWKGVCDSLTQRTKAASVAWKKLMDGHGDTRWAWHAAAMASGRGALKFAWPEEEVLATMRSPDSRPLPAAELAKAESAGVTFLLEHQRENGSWISPSEVLRVGAKTPHPFTEAITALCGRAMLQRGKSGGCNEAAARALAFLLKSHQLVKDHPHPKSYMDYEVWSKAFVLWFLADCHAAGLGDAEEIAACSLELVADLAKKQKPTGGWSYYVTGDLKSTAASPQSISFATAPVVLALLRARDEGIEVHGSILSAAITCLQKMRTVSGVFAYFLYPGGRKASTGKPGSAGRGPACELALLRAGKSSVARMENAMAIFSKYRKGLAKEVGKVLMHAGPDGQGCHYPMFDYAFAAEAIRTLPAIERGPHREKLIELLMATRSVEGAFRDTQFNGWEYGTGMALLALHALRDD